MQILHFRVWDWATRTMYRLPEAWLFAACIAGLPGPRIAIATPPLFQWKQTRSTVPNLWTGRYDRNRNMIFDGDIIRTPFGLGLVYWSADGCGYRVNLGTKEFDLRDLECFTDETMEVVGNVFENLDLVKELGQISKDDVSRDYFSAPGTPSPDHPDDD